MILSVLKYLGLLSQVLSALEAADTVGGEAFELRPSYKGKKFSISIKRLS